MIVPFERGIWQFLFPERESKITDIGFMKKIDILYKDLWRKYFPRWETLVIYI